MSQNPTITQLDGGQVIKRVYDEPNDAIRVEMTGASFAVNLDHTDSVVALGTEDGTPGGTYHAIRVTSNGTVVSDPNVNIHDAAGNNLTSQVNGAQRALDVGIDVAGVQVDPRAIRALTASDVVTANQGGTWNINNVSGTVSLPTGAATEATLSSLNNKFTSSTSTVTRVASSASNVTLLSSNASRKGAVLFNESTAVCYMKFGATATLTSYTIQMASNSVFIIDSNAIYTGQIDAIWASANGAMQITELS